MTLKELVLNILEHDTEDELDENREIMALTFEGAKFTVSDSFRTDGKFFMVIKEVGK